MKISVSRCSLRVFQSGNISRPVYVHVGHRRGNIIIYETGIIVDKIQGAPCNYLRNFAIRSVEVASREINCRASRSRDKRINSSRNEGGEARIVPPRLLNYVIEFDDRCRKCKNIATVVIYNCNSLEFSNLTFVIRWKKGKGFDKFQ